MIDYQPIPPGFQVELMFTGKHNCPTCSQQTYLRPVTLSSVLIYSLRLIAERSATGAVTTGNDMANHGRTAYCNYTQLKYWGFIMENREAGGWFITESGLRFLRNEERVPETLYVFADQVRKDDSGTIPTTRFINVEEIKTYVPKTRQTVRESLIPLESE